MPLQSLCLSVLALAVLGAAASLRADGCERSAVEARCSCISVNQTAPQAAAAAALVITGVVQKIERPRGDQLVRVTVRARAMWKGVPTDSVFTLVTGPGGSADTRLKLIANI